MEQERIRELLNKYYEGRTSEEEEVQLRSYLSDPGVSSSMGIEGGYLADMRSEVPEPSDDFYARLEALTCGEAAMMTGMTPRTVAPPSTEIPLRSDTNPTSGAGPSTEIPLRSVTNIPAGAQPEALMTPRRGIVRYAISIAAAAAIITGVYLIFDYTVRMEMQDTYKDPEIAMAEVRSILMTVSEKMTTGTESLGSINSMNIAPGTLDELGKINSMVGENLSKLRYLDRVTGSQKNTDNN